METSNRFPLPFLNSLKIQAKGKLFALARLSISPNLSGQLHIVAGVCIEELHKGGGVNKISPFSRGS